MTENWIEPMKFNLTHTLLSSGNKAIECFTKRDLFEETVGPPNWVWQLSVVQKAFRKQQADGSWKHSSKETVNYPLYHYSLAETWKIYRIEVEQYQIN